MLPNFSGTSNRGRGRRVAEITFHSSTLSLQATVVSRTTGGRVGKGKITFHSSTVQGAELVRGSSWYTVRGPSWSGPSWQRAEVS